MRKEINGCLLVLVILLINSCSSSTASPAEYVRKLKEKEQLNRTVTVGQVDYVFRIQTPEIIALKAATDENQGLNIDKYKQRLAELSGHLYVNIEMQLHDRSGSILKYNLKDRAEYDQRVMYYEFYAKNDLKLICNGAELPVESYQYENHLDLMPFNTMVAVFPLCKSSKGDFQILFNDRALNNLFLKVSFKQEDINSLPTLKLN